MADTENEAFPRGFELEITDLDPRTGPSRRRRSHLTPGQRKLSLLFTAVLFVLVIVVILASTSAVRGLLARTLFSPRPTAANNDLAFYVRGNPSWGHFIIDGRLLAHLPVEGRDPPLTLTPGQHTIIWRIAPFKDQTCVFSVVDTATISGPCLLNHKVSADFVPDVRAMLFSFFVSMEDLPASQRSALLQQLRTAIGGYGGSELVRPGEPYAVSEQQIAANSSLCSLVAQLAICYARADQPLRAILRAQLDSSTSSTDPCLISESCFINQQDCRALCDDEGPVVPGWNVMAVVNLFWTYTTLAGQVIARDQPDSALRGTESDRTAEVHIALDNRGWHIFLFPKRNGDSSADPVCAQAAQDIYGLAGAADGNAELYVQQLVDVRANPAAGCLAVVKTSPGTYISSATPVSGPDTQLMGYCLVRFGVVLVVDHEAHQFWPSLPVVNSYEHELANEALATLPTSS